LVNSALERLADRAAGARTVRHDSAPDRATQDDTPRDRDPAIGLIKDAAAAAVLVSAGAAAAIGLTIFLERVLAALG
ncbi:MAG: diacylglycerol kinase, partial [Gemmatimonadota bacterium]|nr:diacylglycerol kinase [Gemmatimonadota bacterium]